MLKVERITNIDMDYDKIGNQQFDLKRQMSQVFAFTVFRNNVFQWGSYKANLSKKNYLLDLNSLLYHTFYCILCFLFRSQITLVYACVETFDFNTSGRSGNCPELTEKLLTIKLFAES